MRKLLADPFHLGADAVDRREVFRFARDDIGRIEMEVLVAVLVLLIEDVLVVIRPVAAW